MPVITDSGSFYSPPRFCPACGNTLSREPGSEGHIFCISCGHLHYRNPLPAVALLVRNRGKILLVRRAVDPARGMLCLPGGFLELGETPVDCGSRELLEETGINLEECRIHRIETDMTQYGGILLVCLEVTGWSGDPVPGDDASEIVWTDLDNVPDLAFRAHSRILEEFASQLSSESAFSSDS